MSGPPPHRPMLARDAKRLPTGPGWAFEIKWDGVRAIAATAGGRLRLFARSGNEITDRYPELAELVDALGDRGAVLDGEIVALDEHGKPSFQLLQRRMGLGNADTIRRRAIEVPARLVAFDLLELDGDSLLDLPYTERRARLADLGLDDARWQTPGHFIDDGEALLEAARRQRLEGVVAKRLGSPYRPGQRSSDWLKLRIRMRQDFLIGGWLPALSGRSERLGSLMLGVWDRLPEAGAGRGAPAQLVYAGAVGSGLSEAAIADLTERLRPLRLEDSPFDLGIGPKRPNPVWCRPELVCSVEFSEWTHEGTLRQPAYKGLRDDIDPERIIREDG
ncbi:MAG: non-homologous end-joining DNA ligase [Solirubrobacterales bacterium]